MTDATLVSLNRLLVKSTLALGRTGADECHEACRIAAQGYMALRDSHPREAERLNGVLHSLTKAHHPQKEKKHVQGT
jgi:hypothetical protein